MIFNNIQNNQYHQKQDFNNLQNNQYQQNNLNYLNNNYPLQILQKYLRKSYEKESKYKSLMRLRGMNKIKNKGLF